ncbi:hypothetical protein FOZ62_009973, partial [Perkinsus olseni]
WLWASVRSGYLLLPPPDEYYLAKSKRTQETQERDYDKYGEDEGCGFSVEEGSGEDDEEAGLSGKLKAVLNGLTTLRQTGTDDKLKLWIDRNGMNLLLLEGRTSPDGYKRFLTD